MERGYESWSPDGKDNGSVGLLRHAPPLSLAGCILEGLVCCRRTSFQCLGSSLSGSDDALETKPSLLPLLGSSDASLTRNQGWHGKKAGLERCGDGEGDVVLGLVISLVMEGLEDMGEG